MTIWFILEGCPLPLIWLGALSDFCTGMLIYKIIVAITA